MIIFKLTYKVTSRAWMELKDILGQCLDSRGPGGEAQSPSVLCVEPLGAKGSLCSVIFVAL